MTNLWCENVHRTHIISLVFEYVQLSVINVWEHITSLAQKCEYSRNNQPVTITLSLIISNKDFDFVGWVIKTPCLFHFRSVKFHHVKETHDINSFLTLVKIFPASLFERQLNKSLSSFVGNWKHRLKLESARAELCKWATRTHQTCLSKTFANSPNKQKQ